MSSLFWSAATLWVIIYAIKGARGRRNNRDALPSSVEQERQRHSSRFEIEIKNLNIKAETTILNKRHEAVVARLSKGSNERLRSILRAFYDAGSAVAVLGLIGGFMLLAWTTVQSIHALITPEKVLPAGFIKRDLSDNDAPRIPEVVGSSLSIQPLVSSRILQSGHFLKVILADTRIHSTNVTPAYTSLLRICGTEFSRARPRPCCSCVSGFKQISFKTILMSSSDGVPLHSVGASLMFILPSAFVSLSPNLNDLSAPKRLRVIASGAWHNLVLCIFLYLGSFILLERAWLMFGYSNISGYGVVVLDYNKVSS